MFPMKVNRQPLVICIVSACDDATRGTTNAPANSISVRRFIRHPSSGSSPATEVALLLLPLQPPIDVSQRQVQPDGNVVLPPVELIQLRCVHRLAERKPQAAHTVKRVHRAAQESTVQRPHPFPVGEPHPTKETSDVGTFFAGGKLRPLRSIVGRPVAPPLGSPRPPTTQPGLTTHPQA